MATVTGASNRNLHGAKRAKRDEFYTRIQDIESEVFHYKDHFQGKTVFLNCDDPEESNFWRYFELNFDFFGLERLIATHYDPERPTYMLEIRRNGKKSDTIKTPLKGNGDFRSPESVELLQQADVVVTNPPFSLFREYIAQLVEHEKSFIVLGNMNAITYKEVWPLFQEERVWFGPSISSGDRPFRVPEDYPLTAAGCWVDDDGNKWVRVKGVRWFTNLDHDRRHEELVLGRTYEREPHLYPTYDNYDAIEVSKVIDIPKDYAGVMGVPITFMDKHNPEQFEIVGISEQNVSGGSGDSWDSTSGVKHPLVSGSRKYARVLIRNLKPEVAEVAA